MKLKEKEKVRTGRRMNDIEPATLPHHRKKIATSKSTPKEKRIRPKGSSQNMTCPRSTQKASASESSNAAHQSIEQVSGLKRCRDS